MCNTHARSHQSAARAAREYLHNGEEHDALYVALSPAPRVESPIHLHVGRYRRGGAEIRIRGLPRQRRLLRRRRHCSGRPA